MRVEKGDKMKKYTNIAKAITYFWVETVLLYSLSAVSVCNFWKYVLLYNSEIKTGQSNLMRILIAVVCGALILLHCFLYKQQYEKLDLAQNKKNNKIVSLVLTIASIAAALCMTICFRQLWLY